ncbi:hypothetical protein COMNV_00458 [Commensalibacter sp. Nvir]|uniref:hypothetical protein n=1 Tax=Commensalibacter sp. Nvir TaxID=3069817 RepID=UPI002D6008DB|nr:hypothetical protein COMNV_00458 [Commensalibacter sp. Nvir]
MFKIKYLLASASVLLSFASFNTASYAISCPTGSTNLNHEYISRTGYLSNSSSFSFSIEGQTYIFYNRLNNYVNADLQPMEIAAFFSHSPVNFCYYEISGVTYVDRLEMNRV